MVGLREEGRQERKRKSETSKEKREKLNTEDTEKIRGGD
jgi:hypothetical protein